MFPGLGMLSTAVVLVGVGYVATRLLLLLTRPRRHPLPPGPSPWPVLGNITHLPTPGVRECEFWLQHKDKYGPISSVTVLGTTIVILNSLELAVELLEKRSAIYSSRPNMVFGGQLCGWDQLLALAPYGAHFRAMRKPLHALMGTKISNLRFHHLQDVEVHRFLLRLLDEPLRLRDHIRKEAGAIILKVTYGYTVDPHQQDPLVEIADRALEQFSAAAAAGTWLVDSIPALRYLPAWVPGAGFQSTAKLWKATVMEVAEKPMQFVQKQMAERSHAASYVSTLLEAHGDSPMGKDEYNIVKWSAASAYAGGADTSVGVLSAFFLAMTLYPEVQRQAQEEIDHVVGNARLPDFDDRDSLAYLEAVVKESFRWHTLAPLAIPHLTTTDDVCDGHRVPKGAIVLPNIWWFSHDPDVYSMPDEFLPSRFLGPSPAPDPANFVFGFGRRTCPGKHLADSSVWLTIARSLAVFDISRGLDETGKEVEPDVRFSPGVISHPSPFLARIVPRSSRHEELVRLVETLHPWQEASAGGL